VSANHCLIHQTRDWEAKIRLRPCLRWANVIAQSTPSTGADVEAKRLELFEMIGANYL
jgi:hypothetical protein